MKTNEVLKFLDAGDKSWRDTLRPNLTGDEAVLFAIHDIALERRMLIAEVMDLRARVRPNDGGNARHEEA